MDQNPTHIRFGRMQRRESENHYNAIVQGIEQMTGTTFPDHLRGDAIDGATELDLVRSGLEDTMHTAYEAISKEWHENGAISDLRTAAMVIAIRRIAQSYASIGI